MTEVRPPEPDVQSRGRYSRAKWITGAVLTILGVVTAPAYEWYTHRVSLRLDLLERSALVDQHVPEKLRLTYDGTPVASLSRLRFALVNSGRTPIRKENVIDPMRLTMSEGRIVDARIEAQVPSNVAAVLRIDSSQKSVELSAPLLNPNDVVFFALFVDRVPAPNFEAIARVADLRALEVQDRRPSTTPAWRRLPVRFYVVSLFTVLDFYLLCSLLVRYGELRRERHLTSTLLAAVSPDNAAAFRIYVRAIFWAVVDSPRVAPLLEPLQDPKARVESAVLQRISEALQLAERDARKVATWIAIALLFTLFVGTAYILWIGSAALTNSR